MDAGQVQSLLDEILDQALVHHGFVDYMRDYELIVHCTADPATGVAPSFERLLFTHCVSASVTTALPADVWAQSLDDRLTDYASGVDLDGYVWGVKWQVLYPGAVVIGSPPLLNDGRRHSGSGFHEVLIETNSHNLSLVFSGLQRSEVEPGVTPFAVPPEGPDWKFPLR